MNETIEFLSPTSSRFLIAMLATAIVAYAAVRIGWGRANKLSKAWPLYVLRGLLLLALLALLLNPVRVTEQPGSIEPSQVFYMLDASESMAIGNEEATRWDQAVNMIRSSAKASLDSAAAEINLFRFGRRLKAVDSPEVLGLADELGDEGMGVSFAKRDPSKDAETTDSEVKSAANEPDTQMFVALRQISSRFGRKPPKAVVVFSDGRARDAGQAQQVAAAFTKLGVPIHCVPVGNTESGGDVALVSLVVPRSARKQSEVLAQAFLRSYGFDGRQVEIKLNSIHESGRRTGRLATVPLTLQSGFQSVPITFRTAAETQMIEAIVSDIPNEVSTDNNRFETEIEITREKIRVLYVEGSRLPRVPITVNGRVTFEGPTSALQNSLQEDDDIECRAIQVSVSQVGRASSLQSFPQSVAELSSFDAIILSDVPQRTFTPKQLGWIERWVRQRGGGLCMVGGRNSFSTGGWQGTPIGQMLPVELTKNMDWRSDVKVSLQPDLKGKPHPLFRFASDDDRNREIAGQFPGFHGANVGLKPKPNLARVLAVARPGELVPAVVERSPLFSAQGIREMFTQRPAENPDTGMPDEFAAITVSQYGKGRTMAMPFPITGNPASEFRAWGSSAENGAEHYSQFWRNTIYWLTEQSYIGRRRLVATADKRYYGPGARITVTGTAFDESANETSNYVLEGVIEPQSFDNIESEYSIVRWPNNMPRTEEAESPFMMWGEVFQIPVKKIAGKNVYQIELELAESLPSGTANQSLRLELTANEDQTQVDSTSVPVQILHDPFEQQNPFPDHELMTTLAETSGGQVISNERELAKMLATLPVERGPSEMAMAPIWSKWWALVALFGIVSVEWGYRRWIGLA